MITTFQKNGEIANAREAVVAVQDADHHPRRPEQDQDREEDLRERDGEVEDLAAEPGGEDRHDQRARASTKIAVIAPSTSVTR